jgi:hypothetical protein
MILLQNPNIPSPTDPVEIDRAIQDLQMKLANALVWLTQSYPRAYPQIESTQKTKGNFVFPAVYLGKANNDYKYLNAAPDNDKTAQCFFLVDTETVQDFVRGEHNILAYNLAIVFTANLKLVNDTVLSTEIFQANLIQQVREVLTREITLTPYDLVINEVKLLFKDAYREFQLSNAAVLEKAPFTHFRFDCTITLQEECNTPILNRCEAIKQHIQDSDLDCLQTLYDYSIQARLDGLSPTQVTDLQTAFCTPCPPLPSTCEEKLAFIASVRDTCFIPSLAFEAGNDSDFNALNPTQKSDLSLRICSSPILTQYSMSFDGGNEYVYLHDEPDFNFTNLQPFSFCSWVKSTNYGGNYQGILSKRDGATFKGYSCFFYLGDLYVVLRSSAGNFIFIRTTGVSFVNSTWYHVGVTILGNSLASGIKIYVNGVQKTTVTIQDNLNATIANSQPLLIGTDLTGGFYFGGKIGYTSIFNIELSGANMITEYNIGTMLENSPQAASQVMFWKSGQGGLFGGSDWLFPNALDINKLAPYSVNMEQADRTTDVPI